MIKFSKTIFLFILAYSFGFGSPEAWANPTKSKIGSHMGISLGMDEKSVRTMLEETQKFKIRESTKQFAKTAVNCLKQSTNGKSMILCFLPPDEKVDLLVVAFNAAGAVSTIAERFSEYQKGTSLSIVTSSLGKEFNREPLTKDFVPAIKPQQVLEKCPPGKCELLVWVDKVNSVYATGILEKSSNHIMEFSINDVSHEELDKFLNRNTIKK